MRRRIRYRLILLRSQRFIYLLTCCLLFFVQYLFSIALYWEPIPSPISSRLQPDLPLTIDLRSYAVCHPNELYLKNITLYYHQHSQQQQTCFLIEHLDGGPWWSYVTHEFAEILTHLKEIGIESNIKYRSFISQSDIDYQTNLTKYILNSCNLDESFYIQNQSPIVILIWDVNRILWHKMHFQWKSLFEKLNIRVLVFINDLHYTKKEYFFSRQYLFQSIASEIFSTYAYLFHNYYYNISSLKLTWLPHAASTLSYRTINQSAENLLFVSGANIYEWYPCRSRAFSLCNFYQKNVTGCLKHPGYGVTMKNDSSYFYGGRRYFSYMQRYVFGLGTCQSVHYAIAKLFELPANGLVLVTTDDLVPILERLNFYHNEHYLTVDCSSTNRLMSEIKRLQNMSQDLIYDIRIKSQQLVYERHMTRHRAELLHVRLLAQALIATSSSETERIQWEQWGRNCQ